MKHVWVVHGIGYAGAYGRTEWLEGVFATMRAVDKHVRSVLDGAKYSRSEGVYYRDKDYDMYVVRKKEVIR